MTKFQLRNCFPNVFREDGGVLLEFTIVLPLLVTLLIGLVDIGRMLNEYLIMTQIVREGTRYASGLGELESGVPGGIPFVNIQNPDGPMAQLYPNQSLVQNRIDVLMVVENLSTNSMQITTSFDPNPDGNTLTNDKQVTVSITREYLAIFPPFNHFKISVTEVGPYLY